MNHSLDPDGSQLATLRALDAEAPIAALNLFEFNERAHYQPDDREYGTDAANVSGRKAFDRYLSAAGAVLRSLGGRVVLSTGVDQVMIGPSRPQWHVAAIMFFPSRRAFVEMTMDPEFRAASRHRKAALASHTMLHLNGAPWS